MGLPIFITPVEPEVATRATEKAAAGPRSSIRRQRTIRGGPQARSTEIRRRRIQDTLENEARENQQIHPSNGSDMASIATLQARAHRLYENERAALGDPLSWERESPDRGAIRGYYTSGSMGASLPPAPEPESEARISGEREIERLHQVRRDLRRMGRRRPAPTPPYTETDMAFIGSSARDSPRPSSLTPALSPSRLSPPDVEAEALDVRNVQEASDLATLVAARASRYRILREEHIERADRVRAINERRSRSSFREFLQRTRMDGLGDRERSPEWDTLLTSIAPDPQPPSAGSSFASTAAAATSSTSGPSWATPSMTSMERSGESSALRDCDEPTSSDSNTDDDDDERITEDFSVFVNGARVGGDPSWTSSYAEVARANRGAHSPDQSLEGMQRIISRLAERDDIPESWWASAGLRREPSA